MTTSQVEFTEDELLADHAIAEPLIANGVRCHGGFDEDGAYVSPRTANRWPAIRAWEEQRVEQFALGEGDLCGRHDAPPWGFDPGANCKRLRIHLTRVRMPM